MWTQFMDMHSGGGIKEEPYQYIYIEAPEDEAKTIFYNRFGHNPERVTCTCCGDDYSISESATLEEASAYERGCGYCNVQNKYVDEPDRKNSRKTYRTLEEYKTDNRVLIIAAADIKDDEREGDVPEEGYVWV